MSILDNKSRQLAAQAGVNLNTAGLNSAAVLAYALLDAADNEPGAYIKNNALYNRNGLFIMDLAVGGRSRSVIEDFAGYDTNDSVSVVQVTNAARATTTGLMHLMTTPKGNVFGCANIGVQTTSPVMAAAGLDIRGVETNAIGTELFSHGHLQTGRPFIVGNDAAFFFRVSLTIANISGATVLLAGFRRAEANNITYTSYADYYAAGTIASAATGAINVAAEINGSGASPTDTTDTWADGATKIIEVRVSAAGVCSLLINGVAPTVPSAQTFDDGDPLIPFVHFIQHTDIAGEVTINFWQAGLQ